MVENALHESAAKRILHKLNPVHHKDKDNGKGKANDDTAEVHQSPEVTDDVKPLVERTKHVHSHASHPTVESCAPFLTSGCSTSLQCRVADLLGANSGPPSSTVTPCRHSV